MVDMSTLEGKAAVVNGSTAGRRLGMARALVSIRAVASPNLYLSPDGASAPARANLAIDGGWTAQ